MSAENSEDILAAFFQQKRTLFRTALLLHCSRVRLPGLTQGVHASLCYAVQKHSSKGSRRRKHI
jgi:hypothetical protein